MIHQTSAAPKCSVISYSPFGSLSQSNNPHAWQSIGAADVYVSNIAAAFRSVDAASCTDDEANVAANVAELTRESRGQNAPAVLADSRLVEQVAAEAGLTLCGTLYSDALSEPEGPASTRVAMMRANFSTITTAIAAE